jgi:CarD family transcriptional regulator
MFNIGDKVVYPMHGAGIIESIEEQEILGERQKYYIMHMPIGDLKMMVPLQNVESVGLRGVVDASTMDQVLESMRECRPHDPTSWNHRYRANWNKIKSGDIYAVADVVRSLMDREGEKGLSTGERKMLDNAKQILISELVLARNLKQEQAFELIDSIVIDCHLP